MSLDSKKIFITAGIIFLFTTGLWVVSGDEISQFFSEGESKLFQIGKGQEVTLLIDYGEGETKIFEAEFKEGMTAFSLLESETEKANLSLKTKAYDIGIFIETIGNKENGQDGKYWMYYVNGELPMIAADKNELNFGDKIEFKFEKSPF